MGGFCHVFRKFGFRQIIGAGITVDRQLQRGRKPGREYARCLRTGRKPHNNIAGTGWGGKAAKANESFHWLTNRDNAKMQGSRFADDRIYSAYTVVIGKWLG